MAAPSVHNASGKKCYLCKKEFEKQSFNITISDRNSPKGFIVKRKVCGSCHQKHYEAGE